MRRIGRTWIVVALVAALAPAPGRGEDAGGRQLDFQVIVNPQVPLQAIDRRLLAEVFLKKSTRWSDGKTIYPVDLAADSPVRRRFSEAVLRRSVSAVRAYWQPVIFSGRDVPPPELATDRAVVAYVNKHPGAIGYVSPGAEIGRARPIRVE